MKCKKLTIETNGTTAGTRIIADDKVLGLVQRLNFSADLSNPFVTLQIETARQKEDREIPKDEKGNPIGPTVKMKTVQVRDSKSQKIVEKQEVVVEPLRIEFER